MSSELKHLDPKAPSKLHLFSFYIGITSIDGLCCSILGIIFMDNQIYYNKLENLHVHAVNCILIWSNPQHMFSGAVNNVSSLELELSILNGLK